MTTDYAQFGITQDMGTTAVSEGLANPQGHRGGVSMFFMDAQKGYPTLQAIDDSTYLHMVRKGRQPLEHYGKHRTVSFVVNGRKVRPPTDVEILRLFAQGHRVAGVDPTPEMQAECELWLSRIYTPWVADSATSFAARDGKVFGSRFAMEAYELGQAAAGASPPSEVKPPADDLAPVATHPCPTCGKGHANKGVLAMHVKREHLT